MAPSAPPGGERPARSLDAAVHLSLPTGWTPTTLPADAAFNGVYSPVQGLRRGQDNLLGGYKYLELQRDGVTHEGVDLNSMGAGDADLGARCLAPLGGRVTFVQRWDGYSTGFGTHLALWIDDGRAAAPCFLHVAHLDTVAVSEGQGVAAGQLLGTVGKSGHQVYAHAHVALWHAVPPGGWSFWQRGYSRAWVAAQTLNPQTWFWASVARAGRAPEEAVVAILSGAQAAAVQAVVWGGYWDPAAAEHAIQAAWRTEWRRGVWRGKPLSTEQPLPADAAAGKGAGAFRLFEFGVACWLPDQPVSWDA